MGLQAQDLGRELAMQRHVAMRCGFVGTQKQKRQDVQQINRDEEAELDVGSVVVVVLALI